MTDLPYVLSLFLTFSRKKSQLDAVQALFFRFFFETVGHLEGINAHRRCPALQGARARHSRFRGNLGSIFFRSKIDFFSILISIKRGLAQVWTHFRTNFLRGVFPFGRCNGAGPKRTFGGRNPPKPPKPLENPRTLTKWSIFEYIGRKNMSKYVAAVRETNC